MTSTKNVKQKTNLLSPYKLMIYGGAWLAIWLVSMTVFELRERMIVWGVFGPNCGSCSEQTTASIIAAIWMPLVLGSFVFSIGVANALWRRIEQPVLAVMIKLSTIILILAATTYFFYGLYAVLNLLLL